MIKINKENKSCIKPLVTFIFGTRPEAIKLAPVIKKFYECSRIQIRVINTGQHRDLVGGVLNTFGIVIDKNFDVMLEKPSLTNLNCLILKSLEEEFNEHNPKLVIVQGDTATAYCAALSAFYKRISVAHVEAGLRTNDIYAPFPEEVNRRLISQISLLHFAPTKLAKFNLLKSNVNGKVFNTGNTVIDAILDISKRDYKFSIPDIDFKKDKVILATIHRRENWGENLSNICLGLLEIIKIHKDVKILLPFHPNKVVQKPIKKILGTHRRVILVESLEYIELVHVLKSCFLVITDSGGIQEEAPTFNKPVLITREKTERAEGIKVGTSKLVGTDKKEIFNAANQLLNDNELYKKMSSAKNPFGDGKSSEKILKECLNYLKINY